MRDSLGRKRCDSCYSLYCIKTIEFNLSYNRKTVDLCRGCRLELAEMIMKEMKDGDKNDN